MFLSAKYIVLKRKMDERITIADVQIYLLKVVRPVNTAALTAWVGTFPKVLP